MYRHVILQVLTLRTSPYVHGYLLRISEGGTLDGTRLTNVAIGCGYMAAE